MTDWWLFGKKIKINLEYKRIRFIFVLLNQYYMEYRNKTQARKETGINYLGSVNLTSKHAKAYKYDELTYSLYLAPADLSGYEVCPMRNAECTALCLNESGMNRMNMNNDMITESRIKKTKLFFEHRQYFMQWMVAEIEAAKKKAEKQGYHFSVRLNNTSDISPESFHMEIDGKRKNILQLFPDVMFYDYSKVGKRMELVKKYKNYDLTFSFSGTNFSDCISMLNNGIRVAVVFKKEIPKKFWGRKVIDGDLYDMRYRDENDIIVGLKYKVTRKRPQKDSKFIVDPSQ